VGEKMHFSILFGFPLGVFFFFSYPFSFSIGDALKRITPRMPTRYLGHVVVNKKNNNEGLFWAL
jgi:hypothetical protein